jgi:chaperone modulatory protein CbpM
MSNADSAPLTCEVVEERVELTLEALCHSCDAPADLVLELVAHGVLNPAGHHHEAWRFAGESLGVARRATRMMTDLGLNAAGAALAIELLERIDQLERSSR